MSVLREISLNNGQVLKNIEYEGSEEEFEKAWLAEYIITLERKEAMTTDTIRLHTDSIVYYAFAKKD